MCCFFLALIMFGPRLGFLIYWLIPAGQVKVNLAFNTFIWPLLGLIFVPWTTLIYVIIFPINGFDWLWIGLALLADIVSWGGSAWRRNEVPGYSGP